MKGYKAFEIHMLEVYRELVYFDRKQGFQQPNVETSTANLQERWKQTNKGSYLSSAWQRIKAKISFVCPECTGWSKAYTTRDEKATLPKT